MDQTIVLATDTDGNDVTIAQVNAWLQTGDKKNLSELFYYRFYGRYLRPFDYPADTYKKKFKNGFAIMASCCLMIETFVSWTEPAFRDTHGNSERCFGYFFLSQPRFKEFSKGGLSESDYLNVGPSKKKLNNTGIPSDFFRNVRCGILHNGETRNGWKIVREGDFFDLKSKKINSVKFMNRLKLVITDFKNELISSNFHTSVTWNTYRDRLTDLINKS